MRSRSVCQHWGGVVSREWPREWSEEGSQRSGHQGGWERSVGKWSSESGWEMASSVVGKSSAGSGWRVDHPESS